MKYIIIDTEFLQVFSVEEAVILSVIKYHAENNLKISYQKIANILHKNRSNICRKIKNMVLSIRQQRCCQYDNKSVVNLTPFINNIKNINKDYLHNLYLIFKSLKENNKKEEKFETDVSNKRPIKYPTLLNDKGKEKELDMKEDKIKSIKKEVFRKEKEVLKSKPLSVNYLYRYYTLFCAEKGIAYDNNLPKAKIGMLRKSLKFFKANNVDPYEFFENVFNRWDSLADLLNMKKVFNFYDLFYNIEEIMTEMLREDYKVDIKTIGAKII